MFACVGVSVCVIQCMGCHVGGYKGDIQWSAVVRSGPRWSAVVRIGPLRKNIRPEPFLIKL